MILFYRKPQGAALISALFIVALVAAAAVLMELQQRISINRTLNIFQQDDSEFYQQIFTAWAKEALRQNIPIDNQSLFIESSPILMKPWHGNNITLEGHIDDAQGFFNLNHLIDADKIPSFQRLLLSVDPNLTSKDAFSLAQALHLWLAKPNKQSPHIEARHVLTQYYQKQQPSYRPSHLPMASPSELRLVKGFDTKLYTQLKPYIIALPEITGININHAAPPVLTTLGEQGLSLPEAQRLFKKLKKQPVTSLREADNDSAILHAKPEKQEITLTSTYFLATCRITVAKQEKIYYSLLRRKIVSTRQGSKIETTILWQSVGTF